MADIKSDPRNYRMHTEKNKRLINKSLTDCGAGRSILIDKDNVIIAGNGVYEQALELGLPVKVIETTGEELIAVKRVDLTSDDDRRKLLAFADNHTSDTSHFDIELLMEDFDIEELDIWELDASFFADTVVGDLAHNGFIDAVREKSDVFEVSFAFPKDLQEEIEGYIKSNGKPVLIQLLIDHICQGAEVK